MNYSAQIKSTLSRFNTELGRELDVYNYDYDTSGGDNPYADGDWVETDDTPTTVTTRLEFSDTQSTSSSAGGSGTDVDSDATIFLEHGVVDVYQGTDDQTRATEFHDTESDVRYRVKYVEHEEYLLTVYVEKI